MTKITIYYLCASALVCSRINAAPIIENFDSYSNGTTASAAGWTGGFGTGLADWHIQVPPTAGDTTNGSFARSATSADGLVYKPFGTNNEFTNLDTVYYSAWILPQSTGGIVQRASLGITTSAAPSAFKALFGVSNTGSTATTFHFFVNDSTTVLSTSTFDINDWYVLQLVVDQSAGSTNAVGSLYIRNVTDGQTDFTAVAGLQNISLGLTATTEVEDWGNWAIRSAYRQEIDSLYLSTTPVPEPSALALLAVGIVGLGGIRRLMKSSGSFGCRKKTA